MSYAASLPQVITAGICYKHAISIKGSDTHSLREGRMGIPRRGRVRLLHYVTVYEGKVQQV
ncbi:hypothetical protein SCFA_190024 [anaerobic digester metagenome]|uniref:Uncharacterized protein n=1 Tax=anaerobic digester metagenome TaxID=1263854 RepID=A0A485M028_9ZZZZ